MDIELVEIVEDAGFSATSLNRPGLQRALSMLESGQADGLLCARLDRLTRRVCDLGALVDRYFAKRFALISAADSVDTRTAAGRLVLNVLTSVSEWEVSIGNERTREALLHVKREGGRIGREGFGWRRTNEVDSSGRRRVVSTEAEVRTIARIVELRDAGASLAAIANLMFEEGRPTKRGGQWCAAAVRRVLMMRARDGGGGGVLENSRWKPPFFGTAETC